MNFPPLWSVLQQPVNWCFGFASVPVNKEDMGDKMERGNFSSFQLGRNPLQSLSLFGFFSDYPWVTALQCFLPPTLMQWTLNSLLVTLNDTKCETICGWRSGGWVVKRQNLWGSRVRILMPLDDFSADQPHVQPRSTEHPAISLKGGKHLSQSEPRRKSQYQYREYLVVSLTRAT